MNGHGVSELFRGVGVGAALAAVLETLEPVPRRLVDDAGVRELLPDASDQLLVLQKCQQHIAWAEAQFDAALLQVVGSRIGPEDEDWGREEAAVALAWPGPVISDRIDIARALASRCFLTRRALEEGRITYRHAEAVVRALEPLDDEKAADVEAGLLDYAAKGKTVAHLRRKARRDVAKADPEGAEKRHRKARKGRRVTFTPTTDGMGELFANLPADQLVRVQAAIQLLSGLSRGVGDDRTLAERCADALVVLVEVGLLTITGIIPTPAALADFLQGHAPRTPSPTTGPAPQSDTSLAPGTSLATGAVPGAGTVSSASGPAASGPGPADSGAAEPAAAGLGAESGPIGADSAGSACTACGAVTGGRPDEKTAALIRKVLAGKRATPARIALTVPLSTVLGLSNQPGELTGYGPVPACVAREVAADGHWEKWITDAGGVVTDLGRTTYRPSAELAALVRATYPTCVFPTCSQPAHRCDLDHNVRRVDGGDTSAANMAPVCRRHHRAKDEAGWQLHHDAVSRSCTWTSPAGRMCTVDPPDQGEEREVLTVPADWILPLAPEPAPAPQPALVGAPALDGADDAPPF